MGQKNQLWWDLPALETFHLNKEISEIPDELFTRRLGELSELLDVSRLIHVPVRKLSLGERMKMELIASLLHGPRILFLDEPTIGLDVLMQKNLREFLKEYNEKYHATILLTSHYMEDVKQLAKRVIVINSGSAVYDGKLDLLVKKYAKHKILSMLLGSYVPPDQFSGIGTLVSYEYPRAVIRVPRAASNAAAAQLLEKFPVDDLTIEEPDMEDIVRDVFVKG
jgi:ABC-2 type transport system ATP-binding protein